MAAVTVHAFDFVPTRGEFYAWPTHCKVVYARTPVGAPFESMITAAQDAEATRVLGPELYGTGGVHHYCAGVAWFERARLESDEYQRRFMLSQAVNETEYTMSRLTPRDPLFAEVHAHMARILYENEQFDDALAILDKVIQNVPTSEIAYTVQGIIYYQQGDYERARDVLREGNDQLDGQSAEIHYNLGLVLLKLGQPQVAREHGKEAYRLGYPLPGLKRKLERAGVWE